MLKYMAVIGLCASFAVAPQVGDTAPSSLLIAAQRSPTDFATALANASVPSGLEIRESDDVPPSGRLTFKVDPERRVPASELVQTFNAQHRDYHAVMMRGVLVIRPIRGALPFLDEPSTIYPPVAVIGAMAAARRVFSILDPGLSGVVLNSAGREGDKIPVLLDGSGGRTVIDTLNQIVKQTAPRTWVVTTRRQADDVRVVGFGFINAEGGRRTQPMSGS
jgi:hypothetical protein